MPNEGGPGDTCRETATVTVGMVVEVAPVLVGAIVMSPLNGLEIGSSVARTVGSMVTKICVTDPDSATPLVVRFGGKPV